MKNHHLKKSLPQPRFLAAILLTAGLSASVLAPAAPAEPPIDLVCVTDFPTTSFAIEQEADQLRVMVLHHNGVQYAPFWNSLVVNNDLSVLKEKGQAVTELGDRWDIKWKRSSCNADSASFFQCIGGAQDFQVNGKTVHPFSLSVTDVSQKTIWGTYEHKNLSLHYQVNSESHVITMNYQANECFSNRQAQNDPVLKAKLAKLKAIPAAN